MDADCDDGDPCTDDACSPQGACERPFDSTATCQLSDGSAGFCAKTWDDQRYCAGCTSDSHCSGGQVCLVGFSCYTPRPPPSGCAGGGEGLPWGGLGVALWISLRLVRPRPPARSHR